MPSPAALPSHFPSEALLALPAARASAPAPRVPSPLPSPSRERGPGGKFSGGRGAAGAGRSAPGSASRGRPADPLSSAAARLLPRARRASPPAAPLEVRQPSRSFRRSEGKSSQWRGPRRGPLFPCLWVASCAAEHPGRAQRAGRASGMSAEEPLGSQTFGGWGT